MIAAGDTVVCVHSEHNFQEDSTLNEGVKYYVEWVYVAADGAHYLRLRGKWGTWHTSRFEQIVRPL